MTQVHNKVHNTTFLINGRDNRSRDFLFFSKFTFIADLFSKSALPTGSVAFVATEIGSNVNRDLWKC